MGVFRITGLAWMAGALMAAAPAFATEPVKPEYHVHATGDIEINPDGSVRDYKLGTKLTDGIAAAIDRNVRAWTFDPILVDGRAVIAKTRLSMHLTVEPKGEDYQLRMRNVSFGDPIRRKSTLTPPKFPMEALRADVGAQSILVLKLDAEGNVVAVHPYQTSLSGQASEKVAARWYKVFERASVEGARHWKFDMTERVDGKPVETSVRVPVQYFKPSSRALAVENQWHGWVPGPINPIPWVTSESVSANLGINDDEPRAMESRFKLKTEVVGALL